MIQPWLRWNIHDRSACARFGVERSEDQTGNPGQHNGADAHAAGFQGDIEGALGEAPAVHLFGCFTDDKQLCMCCGVLNGFPQIVRPGDDDAIADEEGGDGDFADQRGFPRKAEGLLHELSIEVVGQGHGVVSDSRQREHASGSDDGHASMFGPGIAGDVRWRN